MPDEHGSEITLPEYYKLVWAKAKKLENLELLMRFGGWFVPILIGAGISLIFGVFDLPALLASQRIGWFFAGLTLLISGLGRMLWCLIRAPHQIYIDDRGAVRSAASERDAFSRSAESANQTLLQLLIERKTQDSMLAHARDESNALAIRLEAANEKLATVSAERAAAAAEVAALKSPKTRPGTRTDVVKAFQKFIERSRSIPHVWPDVTAWRNEVIVYVEAHLDCPDAKEFRDPPREFTQVQHPNDTERAKYCLAWYTGKLQSWTNAFLHGKLDHCIAEFYVPIKDGSG
jgi:hypothetical protein